MEQDGIDGVSVYEQDGHRGGVHHREPGSSLKPGHHARVVLSDESVAQETTFREQLLDCVPLPVHELIDRCFHRWNAHILMVAPGIDKQRESSGCVVRPRPWGSVSAGEDQSLRSTAGSVRVPHHWGLHDIGVREGHAVGLSSGFARRRVHRCFGCGCHSHHFYAMTGQRDQPTRGLPIGFL